MSLCGSAEAVAQPPDPRADFVFHIYVDPLFGDNALALQFNPRNFGATDPILDPNNLRPLDEHPSTDPTRQIEGYLQHAPYAFRTLTSPPGEVGALEYIDALLPELPAKHPEHPRQVTHVLVHCLPGLYGPTGLAGQTDIDPRSGIPYNGEVFPVVLERDRVGIQGTSALDTIFDARSQPVAIFDIHGDSASQAAQDRVHEQLFIDSLTIRSARGGPGTTVPAGAGIWVNGRAPSYVSITNCFIYDNTVGIALDGSSTANTTGAHRVHVVNDTIAWNVIGAWLGDNGAQGRNIHASAFVNVVFDPASPPGILPAYSCFEGIRAVDMVVATRGGSPVGLNFCAWSPEAGANLMGSPPYPPEAAPWTPASTNIQGAASPSAPRVDLDAFQEQPRTLYINDAFRNSPVGGTGNEHSPHDFRLCPSVSIDDESPGSHGGPTNPLVNMGIDGGVGMNLDVVLQNGRAIPGQGTGWDSVPPGNVEEAIITGWYFDAEGFGNPRIALPVGYPDPADDFGDIDIGADEVGVNGRVPLIVGGFIENTRIFASRVPNGNVSAHDRIYFFGQANTAGAPRPQANSMLGRIFQWYDHIQNPTDTYPWFGQSSNYTLGIPAVGGLPTLRFEQIAPFAPGQGRRLFMRNLECDFSAHPLLDVHPFWPALIATINPSRRGVDPYAANPWYMNDPAPFQDDRRHLTDNPTLYHNLFTMPHLIQDYQPVQPFDFTAVIQGRLNPPGTFFPAAQWVIPPIAQFGPFGGCTGANLSFGSWCFNDTPAGCPDVIPTLAGESGLGRRYNLEVGPGESNLQTLLAIQFDTLPPVGTKINEGLEAIKLRLKEASRWLNRR